MERKMKDSGIPWIGMIPEEWEVVRIKDAYKFQTGATPSTKNDTYFEGENLWASIADIKDKYVYNTERHLSDIGVQNCAMNLSPKGSLMYSFKLSVGHVAFCGCDMYTNEAIATFLDGENSLGFLYYIAPQFIIFNANENIYGAPILNQDLIKNALIPLPPLAEQEAIATWLDEKCGAIDELIEVEQKMIEALESYRQATITEAVTRGLNPNAPMRQTGISWLPEIPEHWEICRLKDLCEYIKDGTHFSPTTTSDGYPYITASDVHGVGVDFSKTKRISEKDYLSLVTAGCAPQNGDVLIVKDGATTGRTGILTTDDECVLLSSVAMLKAKCNNYWLMYLLSADLIQAQILLAMAGSAMPRITLTKLNNFIGLWVPIAEQRAIADYLDTKCKEIEELIAVKREKIETLKQYRQSIIFEAVTGKILIN